MSEAEPEIKARKRRTTVNPESEVIESLEKTAAEAKPAPEVDVAYDHQAVVNDRTRIVNELNKSNPDFVHVYRDGSITDEQAKSDGVTIVKKADGTFYRHGGDVVVALPKKRFDAARRYERDTSERSVAQLARKGEEYKFRKKRSPKEPLGKED